MVGRTPSRKKSVVVVIVVVVVGDAAKSGEFCGRCGQRQRRGSTQLRPVLDSVRLDADCAAITRGTRGNVYETGAASSPSGRRRVDGKHPVCGYHRRHSEVRPRSQGVRQRFFWSLLRRESPQTNQVKSIVGVRRVATGYGDRVDLSTIFLTFCMITQKLSALR